jgi:pyruvate-ferredoxin/flavodoxin oxidoreductase
MFIANATGCSSIWGNSAPSTPYTVNREGRGPAWSNSLFEDNAEFGLGMAMAVASRRKEVTDCIERLKDKLGEPAEQWLKYKDDPDKADAYTKPLLDACAKINGIKGNWDAEHVIINKDMLKKPSVWAFGGDGWAYDIGYGGVDHVLASGENINILVFDTEVYSNTGGQASKSTPLGAVAKFAAAGKSIRKKDLAQIAMAYGYVYVAKIAMGADYNQTIKAFKEAEAYNGPSIIIAYAPCINHGIKKGMHKMMEEQEDAVKCGYWNLLRFNPELANNGENPLIIDSKPPKGEGYQDFLMGEVRYNSLNLKFPERAKKLFQENQEMAMKRYDRLLSQRESYENPEQDK